MRYSEKNHPEAEGNRGPLLISSKDNSWIKKIYQLKSKKGRMEQQAFWIEGERAVEELLKVLERVQGFFLNEALYEKWAARFPENCQKKIFLVSGKAEQHISSAETFSGIGAIVKMADWDAEKYLNGSGTLLYLDHIADPGNLGTMIRTAAAFNVKALLLSPDTADVYNPKVVRSAMGQLQKMPIFTDFTVEELRYLKAERGYRVIGSTLHDKSTAHYAYAYREPQILVIGSEANGMTDEVLACCDAYVKIPISSDTESLNAAMACGIILAEMDRQRNS